MDFGFSLSPSSAVNLDRTDMSLYEMLCDREPTARTCIGCGSCSATCTVSAISGMSVRKVLLGIQRGQYREVEKTLSHCMLCGKCTMVCPRGVNLRQLIINMRQILDENEPKR